MIELDSDSRLPRKPMTITLYLRHRRFLDKLAANALMSPETFAEYLLTDRLELEAQLLLELVGPKSRDLDLFSPDVDGPESSMNFDDTMAGEFAGEQQPNNPENPGKTEET